MGPVFGQMNPPDSANHYFIDGEEVVYQFNIDKLSKNDFSDSSKTFDFDDVALRKIIASGDGKNWTENGWHIKKLDDKNYQCRKKLDDFTDAFVNEMKYQIDRGYWLEPLSEYLPPDKNNAQEIFDENQKQAVLSEKGKIVFTHYGDLKAEKVILSGTFNHWSEHKMEMYKIADGWELRLDLVPGIYEYKFIVDGNWTHDLKNDLTILNEHKTLNSILLVGDLATFTLTEFPDAKKVFLAGSFNNWNKEAIELKRNEIGWYTEIKLPPGKHYYKFIVDGKWVKDPNNELIQGDGRGNYNSVLLVN